MSKYIKLFVLLIVVFIALSVAWKLFFFAFKWVVIGVVVAGGIYFLMGGNKRIK